MTARQHAARPEILTTDQTSELLNVPTGTLRWWRHIGQGPRSFTMGRRKVMYKRADVEAWLEAQYRAEDGTPS